MENCGLNLRLHIVIETCIGTNQLGFGRASRERRWFCDADGKAVVAPRGVGEMGELGLGERVGGGENFGAEVGE